MKHTEAGNLEGEKCVAVGLFRKHKLFLMALVSGTTKYDELLRSSEDEDKMVAPAAAPAAAEKEYKCKGMIMALIFLFGVAATEAVGYVLLKGRGMAKAIYYTKLQ